MPVAESSEMPSGRCSAAYFSGFSPVAGIRNRNGRPGVVPTTRGPLMRGLGVLAAGFAWRGLPVEWIAPEEGALSWVCGLALTGDVANLPAAYRLIAADLAGVSVSDELRAAATGRRR